MTKNIDDDLLEPRYMGTLPLHDALLKPAKLCASKSGARHFMRVCLGKPVSGTTVCPLAVCKKVVRRTHNDLSSHLSLIGSHNRTWR